MKKASNLGKPIRSINLVRYGHRETLGDLDSSYGSERPYHDLVQRIRDGATEQRAGGGVRIIKKRISE
jgi:hypothetical protein